MNFLAHCLLADQAGLSNPQIHDGLLAGAVIGDFVKGGVPPDWPVPLQQGVKLHRKVDALSNRNPYTKSACSAFPQHLRRYAPIYLDLLSDYHLSHRWQQLRDDPIDDFANRCYSAIQSYQSYLTPQGKRFYTYLVEQSLLANYHQWIHIEQALHSVMRRLNKVELSSAAIETCAALRQETANDCLELIQDLSRQLSSWQP